MTDPRDVAQQVIDAVNAHDLDALQSLYAADARTRRPGWPQEADAEYLLASYGMDFACVADIRFESLSSTSEGGRVVTELRITGTNTGATYADGPPEFEDQLDRVTVELVYAAGPFSWPSSRRRYVADHVAAGAPEGWSANA